MGSGKSGLASGNSGRGSFGGKAPRGKSAKEGRGKMRKAMAYGMAALMALMAFVVVSGSALASPGTTWTVDDDGPADFSTIQAAVNAASSGDTIIVAAGIYPEQLAVNKAGLTLQGDGSYPMIQPTLDTGNKYDTVVKIQAADITIRGLDISNALGAVDTGWMSDGTHIEHHGIWDGEWMLGPAGLTVDDCIFHDIEHGVRSYGPDLTVTNCEFYNLRRSGVHASGPYQNQPLTFTIKDNYFHDFHYSNHAVAIHIKYDCRVGEVSYNYIAGVRLGVWLSLGSGPKTGLGQIVVKHNTFDRNAINPSAYDHGIYGPVELKNAFSFCGSEVKPDGVIIQDNIVANTREPGSDWGFAIWGGGCACSHTGVISVHNNLFYNINEGADNVADPPSGCCGPFKLFFGNQSPNAQAAWGGPEGAFAFTNHIDTQDPLFALTGVGPEEYWALQSGSPARKAASDGTDIGAWQSPPNDPPMADANGPYSGHAGTPITFDASASYDPDGTIELYEWDFNGNGTYDYSTTDPIIAHTWDDSHTGTVGLRVTDDGGLTATATTTVEVISAHDLKEEALDELNGLLPTGDDKLDKNLDKAIEDIQKSLNIDPKYPGQWKKHELWLDDNHLDPKHGNKVFDEEKKAVKELMKLIKKDDTPPTVKDVCQAVIDKLIKADDLLAHTAYDEAQAGADDPKVDKELEKCVKEFENAIEELNHVKKDGALDPHYDKAIDHYKKAWEHACKAKETEAADIEPLAVPDPLKVVAYPNPIRDVHTATFQARGTLATQVEEIHVLIYDLSGRLVWEDTAPGSELDWHTNCLSGDYLANGMYLYRVQLRIDGSWISQDIGKIAVLR